MVNAQLLFAEVNTAAQLKVSAGNDYATVTLYSLTKHLPTLLPMVYEIISDATFPEEELAIYKQTNTGAYVPDPSYQITLVAEMPDMQGMTSPNNVNPVYTANGHYLGKINLIMGGDWQVNLSLLNSGVVADSSHYFALSL